MFEVVSEDFLGGTEKSRVNEAAGRRNLARSCALENASQKKHVYLTQQESAQGAD